IAAGKVDRVGWDAGGKFRDERAGGSFDYLSSEAGVFGRIDLVQSVAENGQGPAAGVDRGAMGLGVDAFSQATDDGHAGGRQVTRQALGNCLAVAGGAPGPYERDRLAISFGQRP